MNFPSNVDGRPSLFNFFLTLEFCLVLNLCRLFSSDHLVMSVDISFFPLIKNLLLIEYFSVNDLLIGTRSLTSFAVSLGMISCS